MTRRQRIADLAAFALPGQPALSPDGTEVVYVLTTADAAADANVQSLWRVPVPVPAPNAHKATIEAAESANDPGNGEAARSGASGGSPTGGPTGKGAAGNGPTGNGPAIEGPAGNGPAGKGPGGETDARGGVGYSYRGDGRDGRAGQARRLTRGTADSSPAWSPDGSTIAFLRADGGPAQVWVLPRGGGEPEQVTTLPLGAGAPAWSPDGSRLAFSAPVDPRAEPGEDDAARARRANAPMVTDRLDYQADGAGIIGPVRKHLHVLELASGEVRQVTRGDWHASDPAWSPDSARLAFTAATAPDADLNLRAPVYVIDVSGAAGETAEPAVVALGESAGAPVAWSPDGTVLLVVGFTGPKGVAGHAHLLRVPLPTRTAGSSAHDRGSSAEIDDDAEATRPLRQALPAAHPASNDDRGSFTANTAAHDPRSLASQRSLAGPGGAGVADGAGLADGAGRAGIVDLTSTLDRNVMPGGPGYPGGVPQFADGGDTVVFCVRDRGCSHVYAVPADGSAAPRPVVAGAGRVVSGLSVAAGHPSASRPDSRQAPAKAGESGNGLAAAAGGDASAGSAAASAADSERGDSSAGPRPAADTGESGRDERGAGIGTGSGTEACRRGATIMAAEAGSRGREETVPPSGPTPGPRSITWSATAVAGGLGVAAVVLATPTSFGEVVAVDLATGAETVLTAHGTRSSSLTVGSKAQKATLEAAESANDPGSPGNAGSPGKGEGWRGGRGDAGADAGGVGQVEDAEEDEEPAEAELFVREEREFAISDGTVVQGWVIRDPGASGAQPLLLDIHGGPHNAWNGAADPAHLYHQELAARGWTVLLLNPRASDGYGEEFYTAAIGAWGTADAKDFLEPLDTLVAEGVADPARLAVTGYSYGGFMTCYLTSRDQRFAAAVAGGVVSDLTSMAGTSDDGHLLNVWELHAPESADTGATGGADAGDGTSTGRTSTAGTDDVSGDRASAGQASAGEAGTGGTSTNGTSTSHANAGEAAADGISTNGAGTGRASSTGAGDSSNVGTSGPGGAGAGATYAGASGAGGARTGGSWGNVAVPRRAFDAMSPLSRVGDVSTPTLILHGGADHRCPAGQAQQWFTALREQGVPTRLVLYPGASHLFILDGTPSHRIDYNQRVVDWVEQYASETKEQTSTVSPIDRAHWERRLAALAEKHKVPGAALGILRVGPGGQPEEVVEAACGYANWPARIEATTDTLFQIGSMSKVWTATLAMQLVDEGKLDLDAPVAEVLPELRLADPEVAKTVSMRHLLNHTSGIDGDVFTDTGRGDDCVEKYVALLPAQKQNHPLGATWSYCNAGFVLAGRVIEKLTGLTWDEALKQRICRPLGLQHTATLAEEVLLHRAAAGHVARDGEDQSGDPVLAPVWQLPRSIGPAGLICSTPADVLAFARMHLAGGVAADGTRVLSAESAQAMTDLEAELPDKYSLGDSWGIGWIRFDWDGHRLVGHDGNTLGQAAFLRVLPDPDNPGAGLAVTLLTNGGNTRDLHYDLYTEIFAELAGVAMPPAIQPPAEPADVDITPHLGRYERAGVLMEVLAGPSQPSTGQHAGPTLRTTLTGPLAELMPNPVEEHPMTAFGPDLWLVRAPGTETWTPVTFYALPGGEKYLHFGVRATPKVV